MGTRDIAFGRIADLRRPAYRKMYEDAYRADLERYGHELTLEEANQRLEERRRAKVEIVATSRERSQTKFIPKEAILLIANWALPIGEPDPNASIENWNEFARIAEFLYGERLPTIRLWIRFKRYIIGATPDGVADDYVYEFKATSQMGRRLEAIREASIRQAILYAYAFRRPRVKVQIAKFPLPKNPWPLKVGDLPEPGIETISRPTKPEEALAILKEFDEAFGAEGKG